ncbi:MAG TPA: cupredoxin domain-containing protein [Acidimicrobiales bacterium]|nr:cupredoxin domain-containing protein [Acidimicrobiales bacterium]
MKGLAAGVLSAVLVLGACGSDSDDETATDTGDNTSTTAVADSKDVDMTTAPGGGAGAAASHAVTIKDFKFVPDQLTAKVGDKITVTNNDSVIHTMTAKDKSFDTDNLDAGAHGTITLSKAGTIEFKCNIHDYMTGTIEVT